MKKASYILFLLLINVSLLYAQGSEKRMYSITIVSKPQTVELIEYENGQFAGNLITKLTKVYQKKGWINRTWRKIWNIKDKNIIDKKPLNVTVVKKLMTELKDHEIETIKDCVYDEKCFQYGFLDGSDVYFKIKTPKMERKYAFEEIYPINGENVEKIELRAKAQKLITILYKYIDFKQEFTTVFKRLPRGYYNWVEGSIVIVTKSNRKKRMYVWK